jgi:hypothetical protein
MKTKFFKLASLAAICISFAACSSSEDTPNVVNNGKTPIAFSSNLNMAATVTSRATAAFTDATQLALKISGTKNNDNTTAKASTTTATTVAGQTTVSFSAAQMRYWDDFYGHDAQLTVTGLAKPGLTTTGISTIGDTQALAVSNTQTTTTYTNEDIVFSNNIQNDGTDNRMTYSGGAFSTGDLVFKHALSKITINLKSGNGFSGSKFAGTPTVTLNGFTNAGTLTVLSGAIAPSTDAATVKDINPQEITKLTGYEHSYQALVIPNSRDFSTKGTEHAITIVVDGNTYYVPLSGIAPTGTLALVSNNNYTVNITINKTGVVVTASLTDWNTTDVAYTPVIINSTSFGTTTGAEYAGSFDLYRSTNLNTNYNEGSNNPIADGTVLAKATTVTNKTCSPLIYFPDHTSTFYFRGVAAGTAAEQVVKAKTTGDYIDVTTASSGTATGSDLMIGAPYSSYTDAQTKTLADPIAATKGSINLTFTHMKPWVDVVLQTTTGTDAVTLSGATVNILGSITTGSFALGTLACTLGTAATATYSMGTGTSVTVTGTGLATTGYKYSCYVLPQSLSTVSLTISTTDGNTYPVTINTKTSDWLIGKHYTYTLTLKKTGIVLTATLTDWVNVNNDIPDVHL